MSNVLLLMSDEHNPFFSSVYGHPTIRTPEMARLAEQGTVYENAYCPSPLCLPSRSAFMAGKRVHQLQTYNNCYLGLDSYFATYGELLDRQGVYTAYVGKTDVYAPGTELGFTEMILPKDRKMLHKEIGRDPFMTLPGSAERADQYGPHEDPWPDDESWTKAAIAWLQTVAPQLEQPWVLVVNLLKPHFPHYTDAELWELYPDGGDLPEYGAEVEPARHPHAVDLRAYFETDKISEAQIRNLRRGYLGTVTYVDRQLGRLRAQLEALGLAGDTNVIYTSDHGEMLGKFGMWWKCTLYEDSVRVPLIAAGPDFTAGRRVIAPVDLLDVQATLFEAVGAERPAEWVGEPLQTIPDHDPQRVVFSEYHGHGARHSAFMVRRGPWKLIYYVGAPNQLYNLEEDPDELHNLIETRAEVAGEMEAALRAICSPEEEDRRAAAFIEHQLELIEETTDPAPAE